MSAYAKRSKLPPLTRGQFIKEGDMLFMIIEHFHDNDPKPLYKRFQEKGRMMPDGLKYVGSWIEANFGRCFQLMECDNLSAIQEWVLVWGDLTHFEIVPVVPSKETSELVNRYI